MRVSPVVGVTAALAAFLVPGDTLHAAPPASVLAATAPPTAQWIVHEVIPGEHLAQVAQRYAVSAASIVRWNRLDPKKDEYSGERLRIQTQLPARQRDKLSYVVRPHDTWARIARRYSVDANTLEHVWNPQVEALAAGERVLIWGPVSFRTTKPTNPRSTIWSCRCSREPRASAAPPGVACSTAC
jgi:LysM repeat protein